MLADREIVCHLAFNLADQGFAVGYKIQKLPSGQ
jgi:hypothetical protein